MTTLCLRTKRSSLWNHVVTIFVTNTPMRCEEYVSFFYFLFALFFYFFSAIPPWCFFISRTWNWGFCNRWMKKTREENDMKTCVVEKLYKAFEKRHQWVLNEMIFLIFDELNFLNLILIIAILLEIRVGNWKLITCDFGYQHATSTIAK